MAMAADDGGNGFPALASAPASYRPVLEKSSGTVLSVPTVMNYVHEATTVLHVHRDTTGQDGGIVGEGGDGSVEWVAPVVQVHNARIVEQQQRQEEEEEQSTAMKTMTLHRNGFEMRRSVIVNEDGGDDDNPSPIDFFDRNDVIERYYPHCESLLSEVLGPGVQVKAFDHNIRCTPPPPPPPRSTADVASGGSDEDNNNNDDEETTASTPMTIKNGGGSKVLEPIGLVHGDYTRASAPRRLEQLARPPKANDVLRQVLSERRATLFDEETARQAISGKRRYVFVNVWRSIDRDDAVRSYPLACADAASVDFADLRVLRLHYADRIGENYFAACPSSSSSSSTAAAPEQQHHQPQQKQHKWMYFPEMVHDEALLIKQWDSAGGIAQGRDRDERCSTFALHSAFCLPPPPANNLDENDGSAATSIIPARKSIEVRCACVWDTTTNEQQGDDECNDDA